jgi:hypothetical protein
MISTDLLLDEIGDLLETDGDFVEGESDDQHIEDILDAYPGEYRHAPILGVYLQRAVNGLVDGSLRRDIKLNLESDNYSVKKVEISQENLSIDAERKS